MSQETAIELINEERSRQIIHEDFTPVHDDEHGEYELARAASCYAMPALFRGIEFDGIPYDWPWEPSWWKPTPEDRIRELVKAGALIVAEIERLQRMQRRGDA